MSPNPNNLTADTAATIIRPERRGWRIAAGIGALGAVAAYIGTTVVGGTIVPGYSHVADSVSSLTSPGAPHRGALAVGFAAYNVGVAVLGIALPLASRQPGAALRIAGWLLVACGAAGVLMLEPFPQDPMGAAVTPTGTVHIVLAGVSALTLVVATVLTAVAWRRDPEWSRLWKFSIAAGAAILVTGGVGAALITSPVFGLLERTTQLSFLSWFAAIGVVALGLARRR
jgi:hypothetical protein